MNLGKKIRYMREIEGTLRGMGREMTQLEVVDAIKKELGKSISQSYLSQIESGRRPHLTNTTRLLLARFFKIHPGYLVDDPEGYHPELISDLRAAEDRLDLWHRLAPTIQLGLLPPLDPPVPSRRLGRWVPRAPCRLSDPVPPLVRLARLVRLHQSVRLDQPVLQVLEDPPHRS